MGKIKKPKAVVPGARPTAMKSGSLKFPPAAHEKRKDKQNTSSSIPSASSIPVEHAPAASATPRNEKKSPVAVHDDFALAHKLQQQRDVARAAKDWAKADALREQIQKLGVKVQDTKVGDGGGSKIVMTKKVLLEQKAAKKERQALAAGKIPKATKTARGEESDDEGEEDDEDLIGDDESGSDGSLSDEEMDEEEDEEEKATTPPPRTERTLAMGVRVVDLELGRGPTVQPRAPVRVRYVGKLASTGAVFDRTKGKPFSFRLGRGEVIKGWDLGVLGMRSGGTRRITCPPAAGYGSQGTPGIPPNSTLVFEVTVV